MERIITACLLVIFAASIILLVMMVQLVLASNLFAHEAPSGMRYPFECCSNRDCAPITNMTMLPDGSRRITNGNGDTAIFGSRFPIRIPEDGRDHACITPGVGTPLCLFMGGGV